MKLNAVFKRSIFYVFFNAINGFIPFLLLPILTDYLVPSEYGTVNLFQTTLTFITPIVGLSMGFNIDRLFFKISKSELALKIGNMLMLLLIIGVSTTFLLLVTSYFVDYSFVGLPLNWFVIIPILSIFLTINSFNLILLRNSDFVKEFGFWQISLTVINLGLSLILVVLFAKGWQGRAIGITVSYIVVGIASLYNIYKKGYLIFKYKRREISEILQICLPLLLHGIGVFIVFQSNRYFINIFIGKQAVGIYAIAATFSAIMGMLQDAISKAINPWFYKNLNNIEEQFKHKIVKMNIIINTVYVFLAIIIYFVSLFFLEYFIDEKYHSASSLIFILLLAYAFNGMYKISSVYFIHLSRTKLLSNITTVVALLSIGLNYYFIKNHGVLGASYSFCFCLFLQFVLTLYFAHKIYPLPFKVVFKKI